MSRGRLIVISGPSGVGKTTIVRKLLEYSGVVRITTATTRAKRPAEREGKDYVFLRREAFEEGIGRGEFVEHAEIYGNLYGTPRKALEEALADGKIVLLEIDVQGAQSIRRLGMDGYFIFIKPPTIDDLRKRLAGRESEKGEDILRRVDHAEEELRQMESYDLCVTNDDVGRTVNEIVEQLKREDIFVRQE